MEEKEDILINEIDIQISNNRKELLKDMCNLSQGLIEQGFEQGINQGIEKGFLQAIARLLNNGLSDTQIMELIQATSEQIEEAKKLL